MTQDVQPLTWQKRTNLEEHQQFFSKINEIIGNLAPTVDEAEQAIAGANAAVATANAASAAASAAASQAQTAASTVAGYGTRLTAAEGDIDDLQAADGQNVKISRINDYAVGLTGNQDNIGGIKIFNNGISAYPNDWHATYAGTGSINDIKLFAKLKSQGAGKFVALMFTQVSNTAPCAGMLMIRNAASNQIMGWIFRNGFGTNNPLQPDSIVIAADGTDIYLGSRKKVSYGDLHCFVMYSNNYNKFDTNPTPQIEWLSNEINIGTGDGYTITEVTQ